MNSGADPKNDYGMVAQILKLQWLFYLDVKAIGRFLLEWASFEIHLQVGSGEPGAYTIFLECLQLRNSWDLMCWMLYGM